MGSGVDRIDSRTVVPTENVSRTQIHGAYDHNLNGSLSEQPSMPFLDVRIKSWNIDGRLAAHLTHPNFLREISRYDVNLFQETHMRPRQHLTLPVPPGYDIFAIGRKAPRSFARPWGGVIAIVASNLDVKLDRELSSPDIMALDCGSLIIFNCYVLPDNSPWDSWTDIHPMQKLTESLAAASIAGKEIVVLGDLNGRIGQLRASDSDPSVCLSITPSTPVDVQFLRLRLCLDLSF